MEDHGGARRLKIASWRSDSKEPQPVGTVRTEARRTRASAIEAPPPAPIGGGAIEDGVLAALRMAAIKASSNSYSPYSNFAVGAAVLATSGRIYAGCNVENASYPLSICAERNAISTAVAAGEREFRAILVYVPKRTPVMPCGGCRQVILEFFVDDAELITLSRGAGARTQFFPIGTLLPSRFSAADLESPKTKPGR